MPDLIADPATAAEQFRDDFARVREQVGRVIVGGGSEGGVVEQVLTSLFVGGHVLLEGVPGIGKTLLVRTIAQAIRLDFGRIQFTPDLMPADITGTTVIEEQEDEHGRTRRSFRFQPGPVFNQIVLADEINRATPKTQSALLEAMQERSVTVGNQTHALPRPFFVLATQNPIEQEGTYPLPEAQLDRFFFKVLVGTPTRTDLREIIARTIGATESRADSVLDAERLLAHQALVRRVPAADHVVDYAVRMVLATHPRGTMGGGGSESFATPMVDKFVQVGASPRAAQSLILAAKCHALTQGRPAASIEDIQRAALPALRHRVLLNFEAGAESVDSDAVVKNLIETLPRDAGQA